MVTLVRAAVLTHFFEVVKALDFNPRSALRRAGLSESMLRDPELRIPSDAAVSLLEDVAHSAGCDTLGLRMAERRQLSSFGAVSLLISHQPTLRDALATTIDYRHLLNESLAMYIEDAGRQVIVREEVVATVPARQATELAIGVLFRMCAVLMGARWHPHSVNFTHAAPRELRLHRRLFTCPVVFDAEFNGIVLSAADLDAPNPAADPAMARYARQFVDAMPGARHSSTVLEVRRAIYLMLPMGRATIAQVAQGLGTSVRSLQRQLDAEHSSFQALLQEVRAELAPRYLSNPRFSLGRISELLGYSAQGSFTRWFEARFGVVPSVWRERPPPRGKAG